ncbi:hypothetical protein D3C87_1073980 [compost metagenome]
MEPGALDDLLLALGVGLHQREGLVGADRPGLLVELDGAGRDDDALYLDPDVPAGRRDPGGAIGGELVGLDLHAHAGRRARGRPGLLRRGRARLRRAGRRGGRACLGIAGLLRQRGRGKRGMQAKKSGEADGQAAAPHAGARSGAV